MMLAALAAAKSAAADGAGIGRVVAVDPDPHFEQATRVALTSWHVDVVTSEGPPPGRDLDDAIRTAHRIARASKAGAVVWIAAGSLWVYDDRVHTIAVRPLPSAPPYDEATSAAIALTVKTLLHATVAKSAVESPEETPENGTEKQPPKKPPSAAAIHTVRIETLGGIRVPTNATDSIAARFGAELAYFPSLFHQKLGVAIAVDAGPSVLVDHPPYFAGTFTDTIASASLRVRLPLRSWLALELGLGPGLHVSALEGSSAVLGVAGRATRTEASLEALLGAELAWKILRVSPIVGTSLLLHYQHYGAGGVQVLDVPPGQMLYALRVGVELP
jgi:hypothetical protein